MDLLWNKAIYMLITANSNLTLARQFAWKPITIPKFKTFLGLSLNMGITKKNEMRSYWSADLIHHMPVFSAARARYKQILWFIQFNDNELCRPGRE